MTFFLNGRGLDLHTAEPWRNACCGESFFYSGSHWHTFKRHSHGIALAVTNYVENWTEWFILPFWCIRKSFNNAFPPSNTHDWNTGDFSYSPRDLCHSSSRCRCRIFVLYDSIDNTIVRGHHAWLVYILCIENPSSTVRHLIFRWTEWDRTFVSMRGWIRTHERGFALKKKWWRHLGLCRSYSSDLLAHDSSWFFFLHTHVLE
jgi:hypothetical protein